MSLSIPTALVAAVALASPLAANALVFQFNALLSGAQEVPPNAATANGVATLFYDDKNTVATTDDDYDFSASAFGLTGPATVYHIHTGAAGVAGPVVVGLDAAPFISAATSSTLLIGGSNVAPPNASFLTNLRNSNTYVNIHTALFPGGEIRGQLLPVAVVPEPSALALMLAGLGLGGWLMKRRGRTG